jgi:hypothetical protein
MVGSELGGCLFLAVWGIKKAKLNMDACESHR